nr:hypothetical protein [Tanacetum cinerariifolium]
MVEGVSAGGLWVGSGVVRLLVGCRSISRFQCKESKEGRVLSIEEGVRWWQGRCHRFVTELCFVKSNVSGENDFVCLAVKEPKTMMIGEIA